MNAATLADALADAGGRWPERTALVWGESKTTYGELDRAILAVAAAYRSLGIRHGDRVVCAVSNRPEFAIALGTTWRSGALHVGVDPSLTGPELSWLVEHTGATALVYELPVESADPLAAVRVVTQNHPALRVILVGDQDASVPALTLGGLLAQGASADDRSRLDGTGPAPGDPAAIFVTSGTTGRPKTAVGFHGNLAQRWPRLGGGLHFGPDDVHLVQMPLSHGFGLMMAMAGLLTGGSLVLVPRFAAEDVLDIITRERITVLHGSPTHYKLLLNRLDPHRHDVRSLRIGVGTAAIFTPPLIRSIIDDLGMDFMLMYGSSEGVGVATTDRDAVLLGSVGKPMPGAVAIVDENRAPLPAGEVGEIAFSREVYPVRYWPGPGSQVQEAGTARPNSEDRWFYSGDLGRLDDQGHLYVLGRLKHQINRGGLHVDPVEVELALLQCPGVSDAAVVGLPDPILGEVVCACVVPEPGQMPSLEQLRTELSRQLAHHKLPEALQIVPEIPRTEIGKVDLARVSAAARAAIRPSGRSSQPTPVARQP